MIIYVEDNINNQRLFTKILSKRNEEVLVFDTVETALEAILAYSPHLIVVDIHLKTRQTGLDLVRQLRAEGIQTPVIALTAFSAMADKHKAMQVGCNDYLRKPYQLQELLEMVDKYLGAGVD